MYEKLLEKFREYEIGFTKHSDSVMFDENFNQISVKEIHNLACTSDGPITLIAVTRHQYDVDKFPKYVNYVKNNLKINHIYFGLWPGVNRVEYDVLYVISTDDLQEIQKHLNSNDHMNNGITQKMALIISKDGTTKVIENTS